MDNKDRPIHDIVIDVAQVFVDPFAEAEEQVCGNGILKMDGLAKGCCGRAM